MTSSSESFTPLHPDMIYETRLHTYFHFLAIGILYYDYLLTLEAEVKLIWGRRKMFNAYWFFANRYLAFFAHIVLTVISMYSLSAKGCRSYNLFRQLLLFVTQILVGIILTLRIYALYGCSKKILCFMLACGAVMTIIASVSIVGQKSDVAHPSTGCHIGLSKET
jgi:hypothetical protein